MKKFANFICMMVALIATLAVVSCGKSKKADAVNLYNYVISDYKIVAKLDVKKLMNDGSISDQIEKIFEESDDLKMDDLDGVNKIIVVAKEEDNPYVLINLSMNKDEILKKEEEDAKIEKIKVSNKDAYAITEKEDDKGITTYAYFIDDKNALLSPKKEQFTELVDLFANNPVKYNFQNNDNLQADSKGFDKFPVWFAFRDDQTSARGTFSLPAGEDVKYKISVEVVPSEEDYAEMKKQFPGMKNMMFGMVSMAMQAPDLGKKLDNDLKIEFDDTSKAVKVQFAFDPADYEEYTDKAIELSKQQKKGGAPTMMMK